MKNKLYLALVAVIVALTVFLRYKSSDLPEAEVLVNGDKVSVEVAETVSARERGLSGRKELAPSRGMLFAFSERRRHAFWMKDMNFPIDIIWIDGTKIVDMAQRVLPPEEDVEPRLYIPRGEANFVLEVASGGAELRGWKIGDEVTVNY